MGEPAELSDVDINATVALADRMYQRVARDEGRPYDLFIDEALRLGLLTKADLLAARVPIMSLEARHALEEKLDKVHDAIVLRMAQVIRKLGGIAP